MNISKFTNREENQKHLWYCIQIEGYLIREYHFSPHREWFIIRDKEDTFTSKPTPTISEAQKSRKDSYSCPDIIFYDKEVLFILEVDGYVHYIKSEKTAKRNEIYLNNKCNFISIDTYDINHAGKIVDRKIEDIFAEIDRKIKSFKNK